MVIFFDIAEDVACKCEIYVNTMLNEKKPVKKKAVQKRPAQKSPESRAAAQNRNVNNRKAAPQQRSAAKRPVQPKNSPTDKNNSHAKDTRKQVQKKNKM